LPLFSGAMIIADAVFLPDRFYRHLGHLLRRIVRWVHVGEAGASPRGEPALVPPQPTPSSP
ncbi:HTTM domain-containing protein, partial [Streptomyces sp. NPDC060006]